jgi:hypothetical protein
LGFARDELAFGSSHEVHPLMVSLSNQERIERGLPWSWASPAASY